MVPRDLWDTTVIRQLLLHPADLLLGGHLDPSFVRITRTVEKAIDPSES